MKCESCGKNIGLFDRVTVKETEHICKGCLTKWGFTKDDLKTDRYKWKSWHFLSKGKSECEAIFDRQEYIKTHTREILINLGDVEDEKLERFIVREAKRGLESDDLYDGWTFKLMKQYDDEGPHYIFEGQDYECEVREGDIIFEGKTVATIERPAILDQYDCETWLNVMGGKYRKLIFDGKKMASYTNEKNYWLQLKIVYVERGV